MIGVICLSYLFCYGKIYQIPIKIPRDDMPRGRKLKTEQIQQAAVDRRNGMTWQALHKKYGVAINTLRATLAEYSDEFSPIDPPQRSELERQLQNTQAEVENIKKALKKRFNLHVP